MKSFGFLLSLALVLAAASARIRKHRKLVQAANPEDKIDQQYLILFEESVMDVDAKLTQLLKDIPGVSVMFKYTDGIHGVALDKLPVPLLMKILDDPEVMFAEEVSQVVVF